MALPAVAIAAIAAQASSDAKWMYGQSKADNDTAEQMWFNHYEALLQRQWEEQMANTAYQRGRRDLELAGLNPILAAGGSGAATPTGASAAGVSLPNRPKADQIDYANLYMQNKALELQTTKNAYDNELTWQESQLKANQSQTEITNNQLRQLEVIEQSIKNEFLPKSLKTEIERNIADTKLKMLEGIQTKADITGIQLENQRKKIALEQEKQLKGWDTRHPIQAGLTTGIGKWTGAVGNIFSGSVSRKVK